MPTPNLDDVTDWLIEKVDGIVCETISYTPAGGASSDIQAFVDYSDQVRDIGAGHAVDQDIMVEIAMVLLPGKPASGDRIMLPRIPDKIFRPASPSANKSGTDWVMALKEAPAT